MKLKGSIIHKNVIFHYGFLNNNKIVISSQEPTKLKIIREVRQIIDNEVIDKNLIEDVILYDFKTEIIE